MHHAQWVIWMAGSCACSVVRVSVVAVVCHSLTAKHTSKIRAVQDWIPELNISSAHATLCLHHVVCGLYICSLTTFLRLQLCHDGRGFGADWYLAKVAVEVLHAGSKYEAVFNAWIKGGDAGA